ncbi:MAG: hypothetical protein KGZ92_04115 [Firmicutes bacterium]|nr:hypothetical protein [Dethiobacter sp.]MBS3888473.1 hypothetical protein [Bacillota bacterium]
MVVGVFTVSLLVALVALSFGHQLTLEERVADFDFMFNTLKQNYPFFGVQERLHGIRWLDNYHRYLEKVRGARNDTQFEAALNSILAELRQGHTHLLRRDHYLLLKYTFSEESLSDAYTSLSLAGQQGLCRQAFIKSWRPWIEPLEDERVTQRYAQSWFGTFARKTDTLDMPSGLRVYILENNTVGYLAVRSFMGVARDKPIIRQFLERIQGLPYLIIDIRRNGGGSDLYWMQNIMAPLTRTELNVTFWSVWRQGSLTETFVGPSNSWGDIASLPELPNLPPEVRNDFSHFSRHQRVVSPLDPVGFRGEIFLLVDKAVFSSAEAFAAVAAASDWATLVGTPTGGDGIGSTPAHFALPNSGFLVRSPLILGLNPDGSVNAERGTQPDILVNVGEDALDVVLGLIRERGRY